MTHEIVPAGLEHALQLVPRLRKGDVSEIKAATGHSPEDALVQSLASSSRAWTWLFDGKPVAVFGVAADPRRRGVGIPWLLASDEAAKHKVFFLRNSEWLLDEMLDVFPYLENHVDCRNTLSIQWLSWLGFALAEVEPFYGVQRLPFIRFCIGRT